MRRGHLAIASSLLLGAFAPPAAGHVGFILPDAFSYDTCSAAGAIASFSDRFPAPEIALISDGFALITPDGESKPVDRASADHAMTRLEASLGRPGIYRWTSGERLGRTGKVAVVDGAYVRLDAEADTGPVPAGGAPILSSQTATVSEAYFSCGAEAGLPDLRPAGRLAITPDEVALEAGRPAIFRLTFDGKPLAPDEAALLTAYGRHAGEHEDGRPAPATPDGTIRLEPLAPGIYTLLVRHIAPAPEGAATDLRSYSTALTFEVRAADPE